MELYRGFSGACFVLCSRDFGFLMCSDPLTVGPWGFGLAPHFLAHLVSNCNNWDAGAGFGRASVGTVARGPQRRWQGREGMQGTAEDIAVGRAAHQPANSSGLWNRRHWKEGFCEMSLTLLIVN